MQLPGYTGRFEAFSGNWIKIDPFFYFFIHTYNVGDKSVNKAFLVARPKAETDPLFLPDLFPNSFVWDIWKHHKKGIKGECVPSSQWIIDATAPAPIPPPFHGGHLVRKKEKKEQKKKKKKRKIFLQRTVVTATKVQPPFMPNKFLYRGFQIKVK